MKKINIFTIIMLLIINIILIKEGYSYYADINIQINNNGKTYIEGISDFPLLKIKETDNLTYKKGEYWLFNLTLNEMFSDYFIEIELPKNIEINYIKVSGDFRITDNGKIITTGKNQKIEIILQYKFNENKEINEKLVLFVFILILILIITLSFIFFIYKIKIDKKEKIIKENKIIEYTLSDTQKNIIDLLKKEKNPITQKKIQDILKLPKSTLSRNIEILKQKNIITKEEKGMSNIIFLNEKFK